MLPGAPNCEASMMKSHRASSPRRYFVDGEGRRVLVGLTFEETFEFEGLDGHPALDEMAPVIAGGDRAGALHARRWSELYTKHDSAWRVWMQQNQVDHRG